MIQRDNRQCLTSAVFLWIVVLILVSMYGRFYFISGTKDIPKILPNSQDRLFENDNESHETISTQPAQDNTQGTKVPKENTKTFAQLQHVDENTAFYRFDTTPEETAKLPFLKNYRNPCWRELNSSRNGSRIRCLPYFFLVGAPKCGTTDLYKRLRRHPLVSRKVQKEQHWLTRKRFLQGVAKRVCLHSNCSLVYPERSQSLSDYLTYFDEAVEEDIIKTKVNDNHQMVFGDGSASMFWDNNCLLCPLRDKNLTKPPYTNADIIHKLNPGAKIIIILRNPVTRLYSEYLYFRQSNKSVEHFHEEVVSAVSNHYQCLTNHSLRYCTYFREAMSRIQIGFYHIFIEDYLKVFPRDQVKIIKLEDHSKRLAESMAEVFSFLGIGKPSKETMDFICQDKRSKARRQDDKELGDMLPKTWKLLSELYKPFNERLVELLGDKFIYN